MRENGVTKMNTKLLLPYLFMTAMVMSLIWNGFRPLKHAKHLEFVSHLMVIIVMKLNTSGAWPFIGRNTFGLAIFNAMKPSMLSPPQL
jgi:hypothetical protein